MFNPKEYEVTVTPDGDWNVDIIEGEELKHGKKGRITCTCSIFDRCACNRMGRAEEAARAWVQGEENRRYHEKQRAKGNRKFTLPRK